MRSGNSRGWLILAPLLAVVSLAAASLSKDDVLKMAREGKSEQAILEAIHGAGATFDLTADDIADLRAAGATETVIDAMIGSSPGEAESVPEEAGRAQEATPDPGTVEAESGTAESVEDAYPPPPPVAYPVYPLYYPVYYPVYDPFFPFFGGFFFSFEFIHVSRLVSVFPCDRSVVVVRSASLAGRTWLRGSAPVVSTTPRTVTGTVGGVLPARTTLRGNTLPRGGNIPRGSGSMAAGPAGSMRGGPIVSRPPRLSGAASPRGLNRPSLSAGHPTSRPRFQSPPRMNAPWVGPPRAAPPRFPSPRSAGPSFARPHVAPMPHGGFAPMGGFRGFGAPRASGGGHSGGHGGGGHGGHH